MTMRRPNTNPELLNRDQWRHTTTLVNNPDQDQALSINKMLVNVTVAQSSGPLRLLLSKDATVEEVIKETLALYAKEGRKPLLTNDPTSFGLHYSQFSIDCKYFNLFFLLAFIYISSFNKSLVLIYIHSSYQRYVCME